MTETKWSRFDFVPVSCKRGLKSTILYIIKMNNVYDYVMQDHVNILPLDF
jgi:hypothetical protein